MKLKILAYDKQLDFHKCEDEDGRIRRVDIMVDGYLTGDPTDQVGKTIYCERIDPYIEIANSIYAAEQTMDAANYRGIMCDVDDDPTELRSKVRFREDD